MLMLFLTNYFICINMIEGKEERQYLMKSKHIFFLKVLKINFIVMKVMVLMVLCFLLIVQLKKAHYMKNQLKIYYTILSLKKILITQLTYSDQIQMQEIII